MEKQKLIDILRASLDPNQQVQVEVHLCHSSKLVGFAPSLLHVAMMPDVEMPVRQAGAVILRNLIQLNWAEKGVEPDKFSDSETSFSFLATKIPKQDRALIRDAIVDALVIAPDLIRAQLSVCIGTLVKHDFPHCWPQIVDKISSCLQNPEPSSWSGALLCLYSLLKNVKTCMKVKERAPLFDAMNQLFPMIHQLIISLLPDQSEQSVLLQKQILKIYFALTRYTLPLDFISQEVFSQWMEILCNVADRLVPEETYQIDELERPILPWWKCKKWALRVLLNNFQRYGSPGFVAREYNPFSIWYLSTFSKGVLEVLLRILDQYIRKMYVSPIVLQQTLSYINIGIRHAHSWNLLRPQMISIILEVLLPLMSYSDVEEELRKSDPRDYEMAEFSKGFASPVNAARILLDSTCKKDNQTLEETVQFIIQVLSSPDVSSKKKDGVLHMLISLAEILLSKTLYKGRIESIIKQFILPELHSPHSYLRVRSFKVLQCFSKINYEQEHTLAETMNLIINSLLTNGEQSVKAEAAITVQIMLRDQERSHKYVAPQVRPMALELLKMIKEMANFNITDALETLVTTYPDQMTDITVEISQHLALTLSRVLTSGEDSEEKEMAARGLLFAIRTLFSMSEEHSEIETQLQPTVIGVISDIFTKCPEGMKGTLYGVAFYFVNELTSEAISPEMWMVFEQMHRIIEEDSDYFSEMMPALHNYVTVDTEAFLANKWYVEAMYDMAKAVLTRDSGEESECEAAKLMEVIILQCKGRIDQYIAPIVQLALQRFQRDVIDSELHRMLLLVIISAVYYNPQLLFGVIDSVNLPQSQCQATTFVKQWLQSTDHFLGVHDRKLSVLGMCAMISLKPRLSAVDESAKHIIPSLLVLFDGLKRAYKTNSDKREDAEEDEVEQEVLTSSVGWINQDDDDYLGKLPDRLSSIKVTAELENNTVKTVKNQESDDSNDDSISIEELRLNRYTTPLDGKNCLIDEYTVFKETVQRLQQTDVVWYNELTAHLSAEQQKLLQLVMTMAEERKTAVSSKRIEKSRGFAFVQHAIPTSFNFA